MKVLPGIICALALCVLPAGAEEGLEKAAREVSALVVEEPDRVAELFDKSLFRHISLRKLEGVLAGVYKENGRVSRTIFVSSRSGSGHFYFDTERGYRVPVALSLAPGSGKIDGLFFSAAYRKDPALKAVRDQVAALPGRAGLLIRRLGAKPESLEAYNEDAYFAIGPAARLYALATLLEEKVSWKKVFTLGAWDKSLSAGRLRGWPDSSPLTAHTLAVLAISENDGTASDALISALGRRTIEAALPALGHSAPERLKPFLKTSELFRLRAGTAAALKYLNLPTEEKYGFLASFSGLPPAAERSAQSPFGAEKVGWSASPGDLCRLMAYFSEKKDAKALEILALGPAPEVQREKFLYAGHKGDSEPGILTSTWLLKNRKGEWFCLAGSWNNEKENLEETKFLELMRAALKALEE